MKSQWLFAVFLGIGILGLVAMHPPGYVAPESGYDENDNTSLEGVSADHDGAVETLEAGESPVTAPDVGEQEVLEFAGYGSEEELDLGSETEIEEVTEETELFVAPEGE